MRQKASEMKERWMEHYACAKKYYEENGNLKIPQARYVDGLALGKWLYLQKVAYKNGTLSDKQIELLEAINFIWDAKKAQWEAGFKEAKAYYEQNGNLCVPSGCLVNGCYLGIWVSSQRTAYKRNTLTQDRINRLEEIGMDWENSGATLARWEDKYACAKEYYEEHGHLNVEVDYEKNGIRLAGWISGQRALYRNGVLSQEKIKKLEAIGLVWNVREEYWESNFAIAEKYYKECGHLLVPRTFVFKDVNIGQWLHSQKIAYRRGTLSDIKIKRLEEIGMVWGTKRLTWENVYEVAKNYYEKHGHLVVRADYIVDEIALGGWLTTQRTAYKNGCLSQDHIDLLNAIGMVWDNKERLWEEKYNLAKEYYEKHGHLHMEREYKKNGLAVGKWIATQRLRYSKGKLSEDKIKKLEEIGMIWKLR